MMAVTAMFDALPPTVLALAVALAVLARCILAAVFLAGSPGRPQFVS